LNYGSQPVGSETTMQVTLSNTNVVNCRISSISVIGNPDFVLDPIVPTGAFILRPGTSVIVPVSYEPSSQGTDNGTLRINSDSPSSPLNVALTGVGLQCHLTVTPSSLAFGEVVLGRTNTLTVTLGNTGNTNCVVEALDVDGSGRFEVISPALPITVAPGAQIQVDVEYLPANIQTIIINKGDVRTTGSPRVVTP
jgi:hypothetical protein